MHRTKKCNFPLFIFLIEWSWLCAKGRIIGVSFIPPSSPSNDVSERVYLLFLLQGLVSLLQLNWIRSKETIVIQCDIFRKQEFWMILKDFLPIRMDHFPTIFFEDYLFCISFLFSVISCIRLKSSITVYFIWLRISSLILCFCKFGVITFISTLLWSNLLSGSLHVMVVLLCRLFLRIHIMDYKLNICTKHGPNLKDLSSEFFE